MDYTEATNVAHKLAELGRLRDELRVWRDRLTFANKNAKAGKVYHAEVTLKERQDYYNDRVAVVIPIDAGVVQQSLVNKVAEIERRIRAIGITGSKT